MRTTLYYFKNLCVLLIMLVNYGGGTENTEGNTCPDFPWTELRLPQTVYPLLYEIQIHPNLNDFTSSGWVKININVTETTDLIVFHSHKLNLTLKSVELKAGSRFDYRRSISSSELKICDEREQASIKLDRNVEPGSTVILTIEFQSKIEANYEGLYRTDYRNPDGTVISNVVTHLESSDAREVIPCFDEPAFKANFELSVIREPQHQAFANMPLRHTANHSQTLLIDKFDTSVKMSSYLFAFAVGTFAKISNTSKSGIKVSVIAVPDQIKYGEFALAIGILALDFYEDFFNVSYPLPKLDLMSVPDFAMGAMENWGLITFRDTGLLVNPQKTPQGMKEYAASVICHEIAHQWFGNLVTMKWWNDLWLNEGFANFMENFVTDKIKPEWHYFQLYYYTETISSALYMDGFTSSHPIETSAKTPEEVESTFDKISYEKGSSVVNMFQSVAGQEAFRNGLHEYLSTFAYKNAEGADLWAILSKYMTNLGGNNLADVARAWTSQTGFPLVKVSLGEDKSQVMVQQSGRFFYLKTERENAAEDTYWPVPLTYTSDQTSKPKILWLQPSSSSETIEFPQTVQWIKLNSEAAGYYRVIYDKSLHKALADKLSSDPKQFSATDRSSILRDTFSMVSAGLLDIEPAMELGEYARKTSEKDYEALSAVLDALSSFAGRIYETDWLPDMKTYIRSLVEPLYKEFGWDISEDLIRQKLQVLLIQKACWAEVRDCEDKALELFLSWIRDSEFEIHSRIKALVISLGLKKANRTVWDTAYDRYAKTNSPTEKEILLATLGSTEDPWLLQRLMQMLLDPRKIKSNEMATVLYHVAGNRVGVHLAWRFLRMHWDEINHLIGGTAMIGNAVKYTIEGLGTEFDYTEAKNFFKDKQLGRNQNILESAFKSIELNIQWTQMNGEALKKWIQDFIAKNNLSK